MNNTLTGLACRLCPSPTSSLLLRTLYQLSLPYAWPRVASGVVTRKGVALTHLQSFVALSGLACCLSPPPPSFPTLSLSPLYPLDHPCMQKKNHLYRAVFVVKKNKLPKQLNVYRAVFCRLLF
jgi:hypothetical protein